LCKGAEWPYSYTEPALIWEYVFCSASVRELVSATDRAGVVEIDTEPLDARIERRLKDFWEKTSCPRCGHQSVNQQIYAVRLCVG